MQTPPPSEPPYSRGAGQNHKLILVPRLEGRGPTFKSDTKKNPASGNAIIRKEGVENEGYFFLDIGWELVVGGEGGACQKTNQKKKKKKFRA